MRQPACQAGLPGRQGHLFAEHTLPRAAEALAEEQGTVKKSNAVSSKRWHLQLEA